MAWTTSHADPRWLSPAHTTSGILAGPDPRCTPGRLASSIRSRPHPCTLHPGLDQASAVAWGGLGLWSGLHPSWCCCSRRSCCWLSFWHRRFQYGVRCRVRCGLLPCHGQQTHQMFIVRQVHRIPSQVPQEVLVLLVNDIGPAGGGKSHPLTR